MALPASDSFTGSNGTNLTSYSANWVVNYGSFHIQSNAVGSSLNDDALAHWSADTFSAD